MTKQRNYRKEYDTYHAKPEQRKNNNARKRARRMMIKQLGETAVAGKDIDHIKPLSKGGSNRRSNLRVMSVAKNRGRK